MQHHHPASTASAPCLRLFLEQCTQYLTLSTKTWILWQEQNITPTLTPPPLLEKDPISLRCLQPKRKARRQQRSEALEPQTFNFNP